MAHADDRTQYPGLGPTRLPPDRLLPVGRPRERPGADLRAWPDAARPGFRLAGALAGGALPGGLRRPAGTRPERLALGRRRLSALDLPPERGRPNRAPECRAGGLARSIAGRSDG